MLSMSSSVSEVWVGRAMVGVIVADRIAISKVEIENIRK